VPIILFALLVFVLLALAGVILLSLVLRYRAGTARRRARPWAASLNVWLTGFSTVFFLSFTLLLSFWIGSAFRFVLIGLACGGILAPAWFSTDSLGTTTGRPFLHSEPLSSSYHHVGNRSTFYLRLVARHACRRQRCRRSTLDFISLCNAAFAGSRFRIDRLLSRLLNWSASPDRDRIPMLRERRYSANH